MVRAYRTIWVWLTIVFCLCSCAVNSRYGQLPIQYSSSIQGLSGGPESFWPNRYIKSAFYEYWSVYYGNEREKAFEREAPFFQEIIGRPYYGKIIQSIAKNKLELIEINSIQKINENYYEINIIQHVINAKGESLELVITDRWVYAGGKWYHIIIDPLIFPKAS